MQIFLSHSSRQKPLIREIRKMLPAHIATWIDEERLLLGDDLTETLESAVKCETDYLLLFLDELASRSPWVAKELCWAADMEQKLGRVFLLVVLIDESALLAAPIDLTNRKYVSLKDFSDSSVQALGQAIASELFALICRDLQRVRNPKPATRAKVLADAESLLSSCANLVRKIVFPHRQSNPITLEAVRNVVNSQSSQAIDYDEFESLLAAIVQRNLVPGLAFDGYDLFLIEEHSQWKRTFHRDEKIRVARVAASMIKNGMVVFLDAGSTTEEVTKIICRRIETRSLTKISVATTSIKNADLISDCCVAMGFDDEFSAVKLFVPSGQVRSGTQAIVPIPCEQGQLSKIAEYLGGFDLGIVGVNGVHPQQGFTTHENAEASNKSCILSLSRIKTIVCDSSKLGITLERKFADFNDDVTLIVNKDPDNVYLAEVLEYYGSKVRVV